VNTKQTVSSNPTERSATRQYLHLAVDLMLDTLPTKNAINPQTNVDALELASTFFSDFAKVIRDESEVMSLQAAIRELESECE